MNGKTMAADVHQIKICSKGWRCEVGMASTYILAM